MDNGLSPSALIAVRDSYKDIGQNIDYWRKIWQVSNLPKQKPQEKSLLDLFLYLLLVEGISAKLVELITFMLMEKDHDLYDPEHREFVKEFKKLEKISLSIKLQFLEKHGFCLLTKAIDRELRNCIAHLDIEVKEDGTIMGRGSKKITDLIQRTDYLGGLGSILLSVINFELEKLGVVDKTGLK
jgi:hypothetical protein